MNSGCICCSLVGDFSKALAKVLEEFKPDRVLIEPSGVGKLSDVIKAVKSVETDEAKLNCFTTVADANKCKMYMKNFGEFYNDQIANASCIVLSHTDSAKDEKVDTAVKLLREHNADAVIVTTPWDKLCGSDILEAMEKKDTLDAAIEELKAEHHHHAHHHDHHDHECHCHDHDHDDHECHCHDHDHHDHECHCHDHDHHDHECHCHDHDHHDHECHCHDHDHHDHECHCHDHDHDDHECHCHDHDHDDHECHCHDHDHHDHDEHEHEHGEHCSCGCHDGHHHHHADEVFASFGTETTKKFSISEITDILETFSEDDSYGMILRAKGIVEGDNGEWIHFDYIPGEADVRHGAPAIIGRLCVIGSNIDNDKIKEIFGV